MKSSLKDYPLIILMIPIGIIGLILTFVFVSTKKFPSALHFLKRDVPTWSVVLGIQLTIVIGVSGLIMVAPNMLVKPKTSFTEFYESPCFTKIGYRFLNNADLTYEYARCEKEFYRSEAKGWFFGSGLVLGLILLYVRFKEVKIPKRMNEEKPAAFNGDLESLERIDKLRQTGALTDEEYSDLKQKILDRIK
jgi:hypothetical protein